MNDYVLNDYFDWLYYSVKRELVTKKSSYRKLLTLLHSIDFRYILELDDNRAYDGENLRWYYNEDGGDSSILQWDAPCTVLEMLIALSLKFENIMETPEEDTTGVDYFWLMLENLDLKYMSDDEFDKEYALSRINMFLDRTYEPDGNGNIIYIEDCEEDLRDVEIWTQMCWYIDSII